MPGGWVLLKFGVRIGGPPGGGGGGGGVLRFGSDGGVPLKPPKPVPIFKGHFGEKGVPIIKGFLVKKNYVFVYFSDEMGENI